MNIAIVTKLKKVKNIILFIVLFTVKTPQKSILFLPCSFIFGDPANTWPVPAMSVRSLHGHSTGLETARVKQITGGKTEGLWEAWDS